MDSEFKKQGTFGEVVLPHLLNQAMQARFTGMFRAEKDAIIKVIYLRDGDIAFASSNQPSDRLGEVLIKRGKLTREQLDMAMSRLEPNISLGKMLVELGFLTPKELLGGAKTQVEEILHSLNTWKEGKFEFLAGDLPQRIVNLNLNTRQVIWLGIQQLEDRHRRWILEQLGSLETVFGPAPEFSEITDKLKLEDDVSYILANIDGRKNVRDLCHLGRLDDFNCAKVLCGLYVLGALEKTALASVPRGADEYLTRAEEHAPEAMAGAGLLGAVREQETETAPLFEEEPAPIPAFGTEQSSESLLAPEEDETLRTTGDPFGEDGTDTVKTEPIFAEEESTDAPIEREAEPAEAGDHEEAEPGFVEIPEERPRRRWLMPAFIGILAIAAIIVLVSYTLPLITGPKPGPTPKITPTTIARVLTPSPTPTVEPTVAPATGPEGTPSPAASGATGIPGTAVPTPVGASGITGPPSPTPTAAVAVPSATPSYRTTLPTPTPAMTLPTPSATAAPTAGVRTPVPTPSAMPTVVATAQVRTPTPGSRPTAVSTVRPTVPPTMRPTVAPTVRPTVVPTPGVTPAPTRIAGPPVRETPPAATPAASATLPAQAFDLLKGGRTTEAATAFWNSLKKQAGYTIQLELVCQSDSVAIGFRESSYAQNYFILPRNFKGKSCYVACWGVYPTREKALQAVSTVPAFFRGQSDSRPVVVPLDKFAR